MVSRLFFIYYIMRKFYLIMAVLFIGASSVTAKKRNDVKSEIVGVWQQAYQKKKADGTIGLALSPILKIITAEGTFCTMFVYSEGPVGEITQKGVYKVLNDSTWRETVKEHLIRDVEGSSVELKYRFLDPNKELMSVEFENGKAKVVAREFWVRISDRKIRKK